MRVEGEELCHRTATTCFLFTLRSSSIKRRCLPMRLWTCWFTSSAFLPCYNTSTHTFTVKGMEIWESCRRTCSEDESSSILKTFPEKFQILSAILFNTGQEVCHIGWVSPPLDQTVYSLYNLCWADTGKPSKYVVFSQCESRYILWPVPIGKSQLVSTSICWKSGSSSLCPSMWLARWPQH